MHPKVHPIKVADILQEIDASDEGRVPRTIEIDLTRDLVSTCRAGDVVTVLGIVKVMNAASDPGNVL